MFNRTYIDASSKGPSRVDVHEHKAPTDASVALLREMEAKAFEQVIHTQQIEHMGLKGAITHMHDICSMGSILVVSFSIGDEPRIDVKVKLDSAELMTPQEYCKYLVVEASVEIARQLLVKSEDTRRMLERRFR